MIINNPIFKALLQSCIMLGCASSLLYWQLHGSKNIAPAPSTPQTAVPTALKQKLDQLHQRFHFISLRTEMIAHQQLRLTLTSTTDEDIYPFIETLPESVPERLIIKTLHLKRIGDVTPEILSQITAGQLPELVQATLEIIWLSDLGEQDG